MNLYHNAGLTPNAQMLRKNMTREERHLWYDFLKSLPVVVHRQKVIGRYIVDFCIPSAKLVIEVDGSQHYTKEGNPADEERDDYLSSQGYSVIRFANSDVNQQFEAVCQDIHNRLSQCLPLERKVPRRGG